MNVETQKFQALLNEQPYPFLFVSVSGAHLYGFPSADSDYDLRGVHVLPVSEIAGLLPCQETLEVAGLLDLVTHDVRKFFGMLLKRNGYVLEQLYSPLIVLTSPHHTELKALATDCITRHHAHHYLGFARKQWKQVEQETPPRAKTLLYVYRVLLTGIHLMRTGLVEANLTHLNEVFNLAYIPELLERKIAGTEYGALENADVDFHHREYQRLRHELEQAHENSHLPDQPSCVEALNDLLLRVRGVVKE